MCIRDRAFVGGCDRPAGFRLPQKEGAPKRSAAAVWRPFLAVSYTHLDVYKRQHDDHGRNQIDDLAFGVFAALGRVFCFPVSYTHLPDAKIDITFSAPPSANEPVTKITLFITLF